jgi:hypothetical protein
MRKKLRLFAIIFVFMMGWSLFVDRVSESREIWGALFVAFFSAVLMGFVFHPLVERPMLNRIKEVLAKYNNRQA